MAYSLKAALFLVALWWVSHLGEAEEVCTTRVDASISSTGSALLQIVRSKEMSPPVLAPVSEGNKGVSAIAAVGSDSKDLLEMAGYSLSGHQGSPNCVPEDTAKENRRLFLLASQASLNKHSQIGDGGATAALDGTGFKLVTSLCCPSEMETFFNRLLEQLKYNVCSKPHVQGLMHWLSCVPDMDFQYVLDIIANGNPCKYWAPFGQGCPVLSDACYGHFCGGQVPTTPTAAAPTTVAPMTAAPATAAPSTAAPTTAAPTTAAPTTATPTTAAPTTAAPTTAAPTTAAPTTAAPTTALTTEAPTTTAPTTVEPTTAAPTPAPPETQALKNDAPTTSAPTTAAPTTAAPTTAAPTTSYDDICSKSNAVALNFQGATVTHNNLGGLGPDTGSADLRYAKVGSFNGQDFDIVVTAVAGGPYDKGAAQTNGLSGNLAKISLKKDLSVTFEFTFMLTGTSTPVELPEVHMTLIDIDGKPSGYESMYASRFSKYVVDDDTKLVVDAKSYKTFSRVKVHQSAGNVGNPVDAYALTPDQKKVALMLVYKKSSSFRITYAVHGKPARSMLFAGGSSLDAACEA